MNFARRIPPLSVVLQLIIAVLLGIGVFSVLRLINPVVSQIVLVVLLSLAIFIVMGLFRARFLMQRNRRDYRRGPGGYGPDSGEGGSGVREPRRPVPPFSPPRAAVLDPDREDR